MSEGKTRLVGGLILLLYLALATGNALTMFIWSNEAWFAAPAHMLCTKGVFGSSLFESAGGWLRGCDRYTYWILPLHILLQAAWYKVFGFGLLTLRSLSILWGAVGLVSWYLVARTLLGRSKALFAAALIAADYHFCLYGALGRMDIMCGALGAASFAAYLGLRRRGFRRALAGAHVLAAASCFTHPCGVLYFGGLWLLAFQLDRKRIAIPEIALAAVPYLAGLAAWGLYIRRDPALFVAQFTGNISGIAAEFTTNTRWSGLTSPWGALKREFFLRYGGNFGWFEKGLSFEKWMLLVLLIYVIGVLGCVLDARIRRDPCVRPLLWLGVFDYVVLAYFDGLKGSAYLVHTLPLACLLLAMCFATWIQAPSGRPWLVGAVYAMLAVFCLLQIGGTVRGFFQQQQREAYDAAVRYLKVHQADPARVVGSGELAFDLGFDTGLRDDLRLGYYSHRTPDYIVAGPIYRDWFTVSRLRDPKMHDWVTTRIRTEYRMVLRNDYYQIYQHENM